MFEAMGIIGISLLFVVIPLWKYYTYNLGAPFIPLGAWDVLRCLSLAGTSQNDVVYDLGCGDGRVCITAAAEYDAKAVGIEIDPLRYFYSKFWVKVLRLDDKVKIVFGDFYKADIKDATVVHIFLTEEGNNKLASLLPKKLNTGTRVISVAFPINEWKPEKIQREGCFLGPLYLYIIGKSDII